jgi:peptidoglycan/xylan/chitin deacetylase (PgdA/CDA1 family)
MKAIMYHYVRPAPEGLDYFRYLHIDGFEKQLEWFAARYGFAGREEFLESVRSGIPCDGVVLTFDDGLADHCAWALPILEKHGLWGMFYVPTGPYRTGQLLDVNQIHLILGRLGGVRAAQALAGIVREDMLAHAHVAGFREDTYRGQDNDDATNRVKRTLNYYIGAEHRPAILATLMLEAFPEGAPPAEKFYVSPVGLRSMWERGMVIGSHSVTHPVLSTLSEAEQAREIGDSFAQLEEMTGGKIATFCYPYGGFHSFTAKTECLLERAGCRWAFNVEPRDITSDDLTLRPRALPRYDCNMFPFGQASCGPRLAE